MSGVLSWAWFVLSEFSVGFDKPVNHICEELPVIERGLAMAPVDDHLAAAEIRAGYEADFDILFHVKIHLVDPAETGAGFLAFPGGPGSVVACHIELFYHGVPFLFVLT